MNGKYYTPWLCTIIVAGSITLSLVAAGMVCALCVVGKICFGVNSKFPPINN